MKLITLDDGHLSLEFSPENWSLVKARLGGVMRHRLQNVTLEQNPTHAIVSVSGVRLILLNDWDEPCLISMSARGDRVLRSISKPARMRIYGRRPASASLRIASRERRIAREVAA
jgi:hypothetical protein